MEKTRYTFRGQHGQKEPRFGAIIRDVVGAAFAAVLVLQSAFIVDEGNQAIVTKFGEAVSQKGPGLNFKIPFVNGVNHIEVRERKSVENLAAATSNQLPITAEVSINWIVDAAAVMEIYRKYGSLEQFENRILDPKLRQAGKAAMAKYGASELIRDRQGATAEIGSILTELMEGYPVTIKDPQIENVGLPPTYLSSVLKKEQAREDAVREEYNLEKQALEAQREVQTAIAARDAKKALADGNAYQILTEAEAAAKATRLQKSAEAQGIRDVESALASNPLFVDYTRAKRWNGKLPRTVLGNDTSVLMQME
jgi:regulator of protease activity HflC (stomatin/prohibitin superfamily)